MKRFKQSETDELAEILKNDGVISVPTDTVYGVCARIKSKNAYNNLVIVKNRPSTKPFPVMCANEEQIKSVAIVDEKAEKIIRNFMPGPITLVLKKKPEVPAYVNNGLETIAVRMATSKALEDLIKKTESPTIDGMMEGTVSFGEGSTIIDCTQEEIKILRAGPITIQQIKEVIDNKSLREIQ